MDGGAKAWAAQLRWPNAAEFTPPMAEFKRKAQDLVAAAAAALAAACCRIRAAPAAALRPHGHQRVHRTLPGPRNSAQQHRLNVRQCEVLVVVPLHPDEGAVGEATRRRRQRLL